MNGKDSPFIVQLQVRQVINGKDTIILKNIEEFSYGKDLLPTMAFAFSDMKRVIEKKVFQKTDKKVMTI